MRNDPAYSKSEFANFYVPQRVSLTCCVVICWFMCTKKRKQLSSAEHNPIQDELNKTSGHFMSQKLN